MCKLDNEMSLDNLPQSNYIQVNTNFFNNPLYAELSMQAVMLHALYTMRMTCSMYNSQKDGAWQDDEGRFFIYFTNDEAADLLNVSTRKVTELRNDLVKLGLIEVVKHGLKNYRIYVANPQNPEPTVKPKLAYKNTTTAKVRKIRKEAPTVALTYTWSLEQQTESPVTIENAESATSKTQNLLISTEKLQVNPKETRETEETTKTDSRPLTAKIKEETTELLCEGLVHRYRDVLGEAALKRIQQMTKNDYSQMKWFIDTIFKAKFETVKRFRQAGLTTEHLDLLTFEGNPYYRTGLESALIVAFEQIYRYKQITNPAGFFYTFFRGYFIERTKQFFEDQFELDAELLRIFDRVKNRKTVQTVG